MASVSTPRVKRTTRTGATARPFSSPLVTKKIGRPPILLEWGTSVLRVGYAETSLPQHIVPLPVDPFQSLVEPSISGYEEEESRWYNVLSPVIRHVFDRLMVDATARRVVVIANPYPLKAWENATKKALWNLGVPAVSFLNYLEVVPMAQGWNRGLVVHVGHEESHCLVHVDGHALPFTYQVVPCGYTAVAEDSSKIQSQWTEKMGKGWLDENNPHSLIVALLKCLQACPTDTRKDVVSNMVFCGDTLMVVPDLGRRVALKLRSLLEGTSPETDPASSLLALAENQPDVTMVPVAAKALKPLAPNVGLLSCAPFRADLISWVGASVYATIWHRYDNDDSRVKWNFAPSTRATSE